MKCGPKMKPVGDEMYATYLQGFSLQEVGELYGVTRQSVFGLFKTRGYELRKKIKLPFVEFNGKKYTQSHSSGYMVCTDHKTEIQLLHRAVWSHHYGPIPDGHDVHHKDHDKANNSIDNLECLSRSDHAKFYNTGSNQWIRRPLKIH